jgi:ribosomal protection tetracycline resistance protein
LETPINIAFLAHVDAGKTTVTEQKLFQTGALKTVGNVDKGTASTDFLPVEKERGISVISSHVSTEYKGIPINIIDTPGHADFMSEVERTLLAVDLVVLLISAADGVQAQTRVLWKILDKLNIPRLILINKVDRPGVIIENVLQEIKSELSSFTFPVQELENEASDHAKIIPLRDYENKGAFSNNEEALEVLAEFDDNLLEQFLDGDDLDLNRFQKVYSQQLHNAKTFPILFSVAKTGLGITSILDEIVHEFSLQNESLETDLSAIVFKISHHAQFGKLAHIRMFSGVLEKKQLLFTQRTKTEEKVNQIKQIFSDKYQDVSTANAGEIVALTGLNDVQLGDVLGSKEVARKLEFNTTPILTVEVKPKTEQDYIRLSEALTQLDTEDPLLQFVWFKEEKEFHLKINGWIQIEILQQILKQRFEIDTDFQMPTVIYKETPKETTIGYEEYTMPKPCWAVVKFEIKPAKRGSGVSYKSQVGVNDILLKYQKEVERTISKALEQGIKGWEVTDVEITLIGGEDHNVHSRAGDFVIATPMAIMNGLKASGTDILEPMMKFVLTGMEDILGQVSSDMHKMRGVFDQPKFDGDKFRMEGRLPFATAMEYPVQLASRSGGRASIQMQFDGYQKVEDDLAVIREFKGISPLDRAKYILKARKALR